MLLEVQGDRRMENPTEQQVRGAIEGFLHPGPWSYAHLVDDQGSYVQAAGNRPWCVVERRQLAPLSHFRAFQHTPVIKYADGTTLNTGAGDITLQHDEWFLLQDAVEIFLAFLRDEPFPVQVQWRSMNEMFGL
ncbi:MAG: hypothetical protein IT547_13690 [Hyphomonadaceae bacterium]|nr:hypothetical protein [Hyphomonadaceae bacterium]